MNLGRWGDTIQSVLYRTAKTIYFLSTTVPITSCPFPITQQRNPRPAPPPGRSVPSPAPPPPASSANSSSVTLLVPHNMSSIWTRGENILYFPHSHIFDATIVLLLQAVLFSLWKSMKNRKGTILTVSKRTATLVWSRHHRRHPQLLFISPHWTSAPVPY